MARVSNSFIVDAPLHFTFEAANRLEDWPKMNPTCKEIEILAREGLKTRFRYVSQEGREWISEHYTCPQGWFAYTERQEPPPPMAAFQYVRMYRELSAEQTEVTEEVTCLLLAGHENEEERAVAMINGHAATIQPVIKAHIEARYALPVLP